MQGGVGKISEME